MNTYEQIKHYINDAMYRDDADSVKAMRVFVRTCRDAEMIGCGEKRDLLKYIDELKEVSHG